MSDIAYGIGLMLDGRMHQTTLRFAPDLWEAVEVECERLGVSAAQYIREATLARIAYTAGRRGDAEYEAALPGSGAIFTHVDQTSTVLHQVQEESSEQRLAALALSSQSEQVRRRAREVRTQSEDLREQRRKVSWRR